jgi:uncharacterized RDD family membrane protein YckC
MKTLLKAPFLRLLLVLLPFSLAAAQSDPSKSDGATPTPTPTTAAVTPAPTALPASTETPAPTAPPAPTVAPETPLHELAATPAETPVPPAPRKAHRHHGDEDNRVTIGDENVIGPDETVSGNALALFGPLTDDGAVDGNAVAIFGKGAINGPVGGNAVSIFGDLVLGPKARVDGNAVCVFGRIRKDPSAEVDGNIVAPFSAGSDFSENGPAASYWRHGLRLGRPMAFGPHLHIFWIFNLCLIALYLLLGALFPNGIQRCAETLATRPGITILTGFLAILGLPVLFILLLVTVVGIPVAFIVIPLSILACVLFGKAAVYALIGRSILGRQSHVVLSMLLGIAIVMAIYFVPAIGLAVFFLVSFLGFSCALTALFTSGKPAIPPGTPPPAPPSGFVPVAPVATPEAPGVPPPMVAGAPVAEAGPSPGALPLAGTPIPAATAPLVPPLVAPALAEAAYPKAGFWIRMLALLVDTLLIGLVVHSHVEVLLPALAVYGAVLWKLKGSTVGGIICGLKVVRHDGRPMDWASAIVRALGCFFSFVFLGLGFLWVAFDSEKQGWHDKIAGTIVIRVPKGMSLV